MFKMSLPSLKLSYNSERRNSLTGSNTNTNTNTINNIIVSDRTDEVLSQRRNNEVSTVEKTKRSGSSSSFNNIPLVDLKRHLTPIPDSDSATPDRIGITPTNIKRFKEAYLALLISYFKNNIILMNNIVELSENIITKMDDLITLISILLEIDKTTITINVKEIKSNCCAGKILCKMIPMYREIDDIIIDNKASFSNMYNQYYIQMGLEFNISMKYVML
jgi:hypothetical protein